MTSFQSLTLFDGGSIPVTVKGELNYAIQIAIKKGKCGVGEVVVVGD